MKHILGRHLELTSAYNHQMLVELDVLSLLEELQVIVVKRALGNL